ncbi:hypothetical protein BD779DRAFT_1473109 [Infundibulicybe gibba]|nr:hypothetical protein BD779DRAFT_1473109 [Infundibulicybe gibba]
MMKNSANHLNPFASDEKVPSSPPAAFDTVKSGDQPPSRIWRSGEPFHHRLPGDKDGNHWKECKKKLDEFDQDFCAGWNGEIDSLLTFVHSAVVKGVHAYEQYFFQAGLFSAVVTAFTTKSYKWLQPDPQGTSNQILLNISAQLAGRNATTLPAFSPSAASIRINIFWFLSLTFSLTAGLLGILCKQWLRRYQRDASLSHEKGLALRQFRYDGLVQWKVLDILGGLPMLLEIGLMFFFLGLADFLQDLKMEVAIPIIILISAGIGFLVITTSAPAFQYLVYWGRRVYWSQWCGVKQYVHPPIFAFKSPQSHMLLRIATWLSHPSRKALEWISCEIHFITYPLPSKIHGTWHRVARRDILPHVGCDIPDLKSHHQDAALFEEYAKQVLEAHDMAEVLEKPDMEEDVVRDIVTGVYLDHRLHVDHHRNDAPIVERRLVQNIKMSSQLRWQKTMLFHSLLKQGRMPHAHKTVAAMVEDVCTHHDIFNDEDLDLFFDAVYTWIEHDAKPGVSIANQFGGTTTRPSLD